MGNHVSEHVGFDSAYFKSSKKTGGKGEINTDPEDSTSQKPVVAEETPKPSAVNLFRHGSSRSTLLRVPSFGTKKKLGSGGALNRRTSGTLETCNEDEQQEQN
ncbi:uncharacterized protein LOC142337159 isoform X1 [Convolutriloba macropyga]|uniref:uncharacterized protein LOC142337159 isoform X1 n=1 Tax=Convolutriloba macropyga TaxID=536237 RepID=UPI003F524E81